LKDIVEHIDLELSATHTASPDTFWNDLDPDILRVAKAAFEDGHFDKAVLSAFIEVNDQVKKIVSQTTTQEMEGASLMTKAFSLISPIIKLTDLSNQAERDVQVGFIQIFAGSMTGIRNLHAHANLVIDAKRCIFIYWCHSLFVAAKEKRSECEPATESSEKVPILSDKVLAKNQAFLSRFADWPRSAAYHAYHILVEIDQLGMGPPDHHATLSGALK